MHPRLLHPGAERALDNPDDEPSCRAQNGTSGVPVETGRAPTVLPERFPAGTLSMAIDDPLCSGIWTLRLCSCGTPGIARVCLKWSWDVGLGWPRA